MDIKKTYALPFPVKRVFEAWISNDYAVAPVTSIEVNPKPGGVFRLRVGSGPDAGEMLGEVLQIEPDRCLKYTWHWGGTGTASIVDVQFSECESGTHVAVLHTGLESAESAAAHETGWDSYLHGLSKLLGR